MASRPLLLSAAACALLAAGCSLILSTEDPSQCATTLDCDANPSFKGRVCSSGFCVPPAAPPQQPSVGDVCTTTKVCTQQNSGIASVCPQAGAQCVPWQSELCPYITGPWDNENAIVIGSILPFTVKQLNGTLVEYPYATRVRRAIDLAQGELASKLPDGFEFAGATTKRPVAVLHCDSQYDPARALTAFKQLTEVVGAKAVIVGSDNDLLAVEDEAKKQGTAVLCSDCVGPFPPGNIAWRIVPPIAQEAPLAAWRVGALETQIMAGATPPSQLKVAVLTEPGAGEAAFVSALSSTLRFNGKSAADNGSAFLIERSEDPLTQAVFYKNHVDHLTALAPDIIVVAMGADFPTYYLDLLETQWPASKPKPQYLLSALLYDAAPFAARLADPALRQRISGTRPAYDAALESNIKAFTLRYKPAYNNQPPDGNFSGYDAFYAFAYALAAAASQPVYDGAQVTTGLQKLVGGSTTIDFGPDGLSTGIALLGARSSLNVRGLWSELDWDLNTHDLAVDSGMFCFAVDQNEAIVATPDQGVRYTQSTGVVTGTYTCN